MNTDASNYLRSVLQTCRRQLQTTKKHKFFCPFMSVFHSTSLTSHSMQCKRSSPRSCVVFTEDVATRVSWKQCAILCRVRTEIRLWFFILFQDKITSFSRLFKTKKHYRNWLLNAQISYTMYSSILNTEWDSNFWTLNFRCFASWTARKLTNASVISAV